MCLQYWCRRQIARGDIRKETIFRFEITFVLIAFVVIVVGIVLLVGRYGDDEGYSKSDNVSRTYDAA